jgi:hypothetical protein
MPESLSRSHIDKIVGHSRALLGSGLVSRAVALRALRQIKENLTHQFSFSDPQLAAIGQLIAELEREVRPSVTPFR